MATSAAADLLPKWTVPSNTLGTMNKRRKRSQAEANRDQFLKNSLRSHHDKKYSTAFKAATLECADIAKGPNAGKHGFGILQVVKKFNESVLNSPNDRLLSKSKVAAALKLGEEGKSPAKRGRPRKYPKALTEVMRDHVAVSQVSGNGEMNGRKMVETATALTVGTPWAGRIKPQVLWRKVREDHPGVVNPVKAIDSDDRRIDWLKFKTINEWTDKVKEELIYMGMVKDEPGFIRKCRFFNVCLSC